MKKLWDDKFMVERWYLDTLSPCIYGNKETPN